MYRTQYAWARYTSAVVYTSIEAEIKGYYSVMKSDMYNEQKQNKQNKK